MSARNFRPLPGVVQCVRRPFPIALLVALIAAFALAPAADAKRGRCVAGQAGAKCHVWTGTVVAVNDGDTIDVDIDRDGTRAPRRVRFAGVQAMELTSYSARGRAGDCHALDAAERVERLVSRSRARVRLAAQNPNSMSRDRLRRTVAVRTGGRWRDVGTILVRKGLALWLGARSETATNASYSVLAQRALAAQRGVYDPDACGVGPSAGSPLALWVNWDADGDDTSNPSDEWVKVRNLDPVNPVPLAGWHVRDSDLRRFTFPDGAVIPPGGTVKVSVGRDQAPGVFSWGLRAPVFDQATHDAKATGDGAYLFDPLGNIRAAMIYPCRHACADPLQGAVTVTADPRGREEAAIVANVSAVPVDLDGYVLKSPPQSYHFEPGTVVPAGGSLRIRVTGVPEDDEPLERGWGFARPILRDAGDLVKLVTYTDITLSCTSWGDRSC